ncbi:MAG: hypothetical protein SOH86_03790 [Erysipelotrichaceae bacterium]
MKVKTVCPQCGRVLEIDGEQQKIQCPYCRRVYDVNELLKHGYEPVKIIHEKEKKRNIITVSILLIALAVILILLALIA